MVELDNAEIVALQEEHPLPPGWTLAEVFEDTAQIGGLSIRMAGLVARHGEQPITGSAAHLEEQPLTRAYYELLERILLVDSLGGRTPWLRQEPELQLTQKEVFPQSSDPSQWQYSKSNGVALGAGFNDACERAYRELVERDLILRSWLGEIKPERDQLLGPAAFDFLTGLDEHYRFESYRLSHGDWVAGVAVGWPKSPKAPLLLGFGAARNSQSAVASAYEENLQRLAFLWGEEIPTAEPEFSPTPDYHQEHYLWPPTGDAIKSWLSGEHSRYEPQLPPIDDELTRYLEVGRVGELSAVKAINPSRLPLTFGRGAPHLDAAFPASAPPQLPLHPIF